MIVLSSEKTSVFNDDNIEPFLVLNQPSRPFCAKILELLSALFAFGFKSGSSDVVALWVDDAAANVIDGWVDS